MNTLRNSRRGRHPLMIGLVSFATTVALILTQSGAGLA